MLGCVPVHMIWLPVTKIKFKLIWNLRWGSLPSPGSQRLHTAVTNYTSTAGKKPFCFSLAVTFFFPTLHCLPSRSQGIWYTDSSWSYRGTCTQREWVSVSKWKTVEFWLAWLGQVSGCGPINNEGTEQSHLGSTPCRAGVERAVPSWTRASGLVSLTPRLLPTFPSTELVSPVQNWSPQDSVSYSRAKTSILLFIKTVLVWVPPKAASEISK